MQTIAGIGNRPFCCMCWHVCNGLGKSCILHCHQTKEETAVTLFDWATSQILFLLLILNAPRLSKAGATAWDKMSPPVIFWLIELCFSLPSMPRAEGQGGWMPAGKMPPSCSTGQMEKGQNRFDCWSETWLQDELLPCPMFVQIPNAEEIGAENS